MARGFYDPVRSRLDPLVTRHLKIPTSTLRIIARIAARLDRHESWVMREWLVEMADKAQKKEKEAS